MNGVDPLAGLVEALRRIPAGAVPFVITAAVGVGCIAVLAGPYAAMVAIVAVGSALTAGMIVGEDGRRRP